MANWNTDPEPTDDESLTERLHDQLSGDEIGIPGYVVSNETAKRAAADLGKPVGELTARDLEEWATVCLPEYTDD